MPMIHNPRAKAYRVLGVDDATYAAARTALLAFFDAAADKQLVDEVAARASHPAFADDKVWATVKSDLGV